jgi:hypothetical protein
MDTGLFIGFSIVLAIAVSAYIYMRQALQMRQKRADYEITLSQMKKMGEKYLESLMDGKADGKEAAKPSTGSAAKPVESAPPSPVAPPASVPPSQAAPPPSRGAQPIPRPIVPPPSPPSPIIDDTPRGGVSAEELLDLPDADEEFDDVLIPPPQPIVPPGQWQQSEPPPSPQPISKETVQFTAFGPKEAAVGKWHTLLVYTHLDSLLETIRADAQRFATEMGGTPREGKPIVTAQLTRDAELTIVPNCEGVEFNPPRVTFRWIEDMHRTEFRLKPGADLVGEAGNIRVEIYAGVLLVGTVKIGVLFTEAAKPEMASNTDAPQPMTLSAPVNPAKVGNTVTGEMYQAERIFVSYSHADADVVTACRNAYRALGFDVLMDVDTLRSGQQWNAELMRMIDHADIFQLFWSEKAADSQYVKQEWEYALKQAQNKGGDFIRPVYWQKPMPNPPAELNHLHFAYVPLAPKDS